MPEDDLLLLCGLVDQRLVDVWDDTSARNGCLHHMEQSLTLSSQRMQRIA